MPFTPTHVAAVVPLLPFLRKKIPFTALAIGAMIPDLPLFLPGFAPGYAVFHSFEGLFTGCLPAGMGCFLGFQVFLKEPLFRLYPEWVQVRASSLRMSCVELRFLFFVWSALGVWLGALSHLTWDSFTHLGRLGTRLLPVLNTDWFHFSNGVTVTGARVLQHGSTVVFLPLLVGAGYWWLLQQPIASEMPPTATRPVKRLALAILFAMAIWTTARVLVDPHPGLGWKLNRWVTHYGFLLMAVSTLYALGYHWRSPSTD